MKGVNIPERILMGAKRSVEEIISLNSILMGRAERGVRSESFNSHTQHKATLSNNKSMNTLDESACLLAMFPPTQLPILKNNMSIPIRMVQDTSVVPKKGAMTRVPQISMSIKQNPLLKAPIEERYRVILS
jgi:hypothetical protein